jgi:arylsulfatase A-like enzyme
MNRALAAAVALALAAALLAAGCGGRPAGPNVLLVTIETFRADHRGRTVNGVALTPNIDKLAAAGTTFERTYAAASFTLPSMHTIATGEPPAVHRARFWTQFGNGFRGETLAQRFQAAGRRTGFVYSAYHPLAAYPTMARGWDEPPTGFDREDADPVVSAATTWLDRHGKEPFFLWVHLFDPHTPYGPADEFVKGLWDVDLYHKTGPATYRVQDWVDKVPGGRGAEMADALYAADVRAADAAVGRLLAALDERGLASKTVVCVTADHGENLSADPAPRWDHGVSTDEQLIRVPLVVRGPGVPAGKTVGAIARHLDLAPTLLRLAGADPPSGWTGRDLFGAAPAPRFAISECTTFEQKDAPFYSVTDGSQSLRIFSAPAPWRVELRREGDRGAPAQPVDYDHPGPDAEPFVAAWKAESTAWGPRSTELNEPGGDRAETEAQRQILALGYPGGQAKEKEKEHK